MTYKKGAGGLTTALIQAVFVICTLISSRPLVAGTELPDPPAWRVEPALVSEDGYAELEWQAAADTGATLFRLHELGDELDRESYVEGSGVRIFRSEPGQYSFYLRACTRDGDGFPACGKRSRRLVVTITGNGPRTEVAQSQRSLVTADAPPGGPMQLRPGLWYSPDRNGHGFSFYWANRLALPETHQLHGFEYDLHGVWYTYEAKAAAQEGLTTWRYFDYQPLAARLRLVRDGTDRFSGGVYVMRNGQETLAGTAIVRFGADNASADVDWSVDFKFQRLQGQDSLIPLAGSLPTIDDDNSHYAGIWNEAAAGSYQVIDDAGAYSEAVQILFADSSGDPTWIQAANDGSPSAENTNLCFHYVASGYAPDATGNIVFYDAGCDTTLPASTFNRNGARQFTAFERMKLWARFTLPENRGSIQIGSASAPRTLLKSASFHRVHFAPPAQPCDLAVAGCTVSLTWFTDGDYPRASVFRLNRDTGTRALVSDSEGPAVVQREVTVNEAGSHVFELRMGNRADSSLMAASAALEVETSVIVAPGSLSLAWEDEVQRAFRLQWSHGDPGSLETFDIEEVSPDGANGIWTISASEPMHVSLAYPDGPYGTYRYRVRACSSQICSDWSQAVDWLVEEPGGTPGLLHHPWSNLSESADSLVTDVGFHYAMGYHFRPQTDGWARELGGFFNGTKTVRLFERASGRLLAESTLSAANDWTYSAISPVPLESGKEYTVAVYLAGSGGSYYSFPGIPATSGGIEVLASTYVSTSSNPSARPVNEIARPMYGQADIGFEAAELPDPDPDPEPDPGPTQDPANPESPPEPAGKPSFDVDATSVTVGAIQGEFLVDEQGGANYRIPLHTAPGSGGLAPAMGLHYNSLSGNDVLGVGWSLAGVSAISRCPQTLEQDGPGASRGLTLDRDDRFCLDGQRLIATKGDYGADGTEYRFELDDFTRIVSHGSSGNGPERFTVWHGDGSTSSYGGTGDSRVEARAPGNPSTVLSWAMNRRQDQAGNYMDYQYDERSTGAVESTLSAVHYTGNLRAGTRPYAELRFHYVETRGDIPDSHLSGATISRKRLLTRIDSVASVQRGGSMQPLRSWFMSYGVDGFGRKVLESIEECSDSSKAWCYPPTTFSWLKNEHTIAEAGSPVGSLFPKNFRGLSLADVNGDGRLDLLIVEGKRTFTFKVALARDDGSFQALSQSYPLPAGDEKGRPVSLITIDINADGFQDVIYPKDSGDGVDWVARLSDSYGFGSEITVADGCCDHLDPRLATVLDFNGDGLADLLTHTGVDAESGQSNLVVLINRSRSGGTLFEPPRNLTVQYDASLFPVDPLGRWYVEDAPAGLSGVIERAPTGAQVFDYNGDGMVDLLARVTRRYIHCDTRCTATAAASADSTTQTDLDFRVISPENVYDSEFAVGFFIVFVSDGEGFYRQAEVLGWDAEIGCDVPVACDPWHGNSGLGSISPLDINGDGAADLAFRDAGGAWWYRTNTGSGFDSPLRLPGTPDADRSEHARFADVSGDGFPEFLYPSALDNNQATWIVHSNDLGSGFAAAESTTIRFGSDKDGDSSILLDFDGDGMTDNLLIDFKRGSVSSSSTMLYRGINLLTGRRQQAANVIESISDGFGRRIDIEYAPLTNSAVHTRLRNAGSAHWGNGSAVFELVAPVYVVSANSVSAPSHTDSASMLRSEYHYVGGKIQSGGRGFLGFAEVIHWSPDTAIRTNTRFRQDFPFTGRVADSLQELTTSTHRFASLQALWPAGFPEWPTAKPDTVSPGENIPGTTISYRALSIEAKPTTPEQKNWNVRLTGELTAARSPQGELLNKSLVTSSHDSFGRAIRTVDRKWGGASSVASQTVTTESEYLEPGLTLWNLGLVSRISVSHQRPGVPEIVRLSAFEYDDESGQRTREITEPDDSKVRVVSDYALDYFGNRVRTTVSAVDVPGRTSRLEFDSLGRFAVAEFNHYGQAVMRVHRWNQFGTALEVTDIDGVLTQSAADPMGQVFASWTETGNSERTTRRFGPGAHCPQGTAFHYLVRFSGKPDKLACLDPVQREVRTGKQGFDGRFIFTDTGYDVPGRLIRVSEPYLAGEPRYWNVNHYDQLGRLIRVDSAGGDDLQVAYGDQASGACGASGPNVVERTNGLGQQQIEVGNAMGEPVQVYDSQCGKAVYRYDAIGNLVEVTGADGSTVRMEYDKAGRKISMDDPDKGIWQYRWNGLGELLRQLDAKGQAMDYQYDGMGRVVLRRELSSVDSLSDPGYVVEAVEETDWQNDTGSSVTGKSQPRQISYRNGSGGLIHERRFSYDGYGRMATSVNETAEVQFSEETTYDQYGRVFQSFDASGDYRGLRYRYNASGYVDQIKEAREGVDGTIYHDVESMDARGRVTYAVLGNGVEVFADYDPAGGQLRRLEAYDVQGRELQEVDYLFDVLGNLEQRSDRSDGRDLQEDFTYDGLNRLLKVELTAPAHNFNSPSQTLALAYDGNGNISWKSDVGSYRYGDGGAGPHAVTSAGSAAYRYDANGNQVEGDGRNIEYSVFDKATRIEKGSQYTTFDYGIAHLRIKRTDSNQISGNRSTWYMGTVEYIEEGEESRYRRAIAGIALAEFHPRSGQSTVIYLVKDHLGSVHNITGEDGRLDNATWTHFGAFGQRRSANWSSPLSVSEVAGLGRLTSRGYTGHEHADAMGLIHMNGRIYDPKLGRFLQADPLVQAPQNSQALNRYSYAMNNPLSFTDPSGYFLKRLVKRWGRLITAMVLGVVLPGSQGILVTWFNVTNVYLQAAITGFVAGAITSGNLKGAVVGALTAVAVTGVVQANTLTKAGDLEINPDKVLPDDSTVHHLYGSSEYPSGLYRIELDGSGMVSGYSRMGVEGLASGDVITTNGMNNVFNEAVRNATVHLHQSGLLESSFVLNFNATEGFIPDLLEAARDIVGAHTGWSHSELARSLADVLDSASSNGVTGLKLVGHSQGGAITASAIRYASKTGLNLSSIGSSTVALHGAPVNAWMARNRLSERAGVSFVSNHQFGDAVHVLGGLNVSNPLELPIALLKVPALFSSDPSVSPHTFPCAGNASLMCGR